VRCMEESKRGVWRSVEEEVSSSGEDGEERESWK
jgi:hypothetical protein